MIPMVLRQTGSLALRVEKEERELRRLRVAVDVVDAEEVEEEVVEEEVVVASRARALPLEAHPAAGQRKATARTW